MKCAADYSSNFFAQVIWETRHEEEEEEQEDSIFKQGNLRPRSSRVAGKKLRQHHRRRRLKRMETELAKMKAEMRDSAESLMAGKVEADQAEAKLQVLKLKLLAVKEIEAFLMGFL
ncbi:uncharacterized protein LOC128283645 isoform X3 [Gossypium arboreum]|uniref:uncharacterized protein LOC128283645 isoform X3 n=1 Tax=Gossypium arboreum TaxID=29729 RepID=UPI0022F1D83A|nr:uncharacterized protein LOC128283645 isoform X3 [Gossypium arboreum]